MIAVHDFHHFGGKHPESAALTNLLAFAGVVHPVTGKPLSEAVCLGVAGGIGAGYSFCPSVVRHGVGGSGVSIVGRHWVYATSAAWYGGALDRLGVPWRITETAAPKKAQANLVAELEAGRPAVVWCGRPKLPFLGCSIEHVCMWMHTFVVYALAAVKGVAHGSDQAPTAVTLTLDDLAAARAAVCSHKNRTLTIDPPRGLTRPALASAVQGGLQACVAELLHGKMKTFSLPGLLTWAKMVANDRSKDGWLSVFTDGLMFSALKDVYHSIVTAGTGGDLYRGTFAAFLDEAAELLARPTLAELAEEYRGLGKRWVELADAAFPESIKPFRQMRELLEKRRHLIEEVGEPGRKHLLSLAPKLTDREGKGCREFPLSDDELRKLLEALRGRIEELHRLETQAANRLAAVVE